jgi:predicted RNase H-like HicB family nuclease
MEPLLDEGKRRIKMSAVGKKDSRISLRAVVYREGDWWIAHCLELDLVAEGKSALEAFKNLNDLTNTQIETAIREGNLESILTPAPPKVWSMFFNGRADDLQIKKTGKHPNKIERFEVRELAFA